MNSYKITDNFDAIADMFKSAMESGKKFPKITLETAEGQKVVLGMAGAKSKTPGAIQVTDGRPFGENIWFGRIETSGQWVGGRDATTDVFRLLEAFAADPLKVAQSYGLRTGKCCFCNRSLSDARSVLMGYGPVCADKHGLEWGEKPDVVIKAEEVYSDDDDLSKSDSEWDLEFEQREADIAYDDYIRSLPMIDSDRADALAVELSEPIEADWTMWV